MRFKDLSAEQQQTIRDYLTSTALLFKEMAELRLMVTIEAQRVAGESGTTADHLIRMGEMAAEED